MKGQRILAAVIVAAFVSGGATACASSGAGSASTSSSAPKASSRDKVAREEIVATPAATAYDLVYHLRPDWLRARGAQSMVGGSEGSSAPLVYLDGVKMGGLEVLKSIASRDITSMEWIPGAKAELVLSDVGSRAIIGVIALKTR
jgi:hypothetical protein